MKHTRRRHGRRAVSESGELEGFSSAKVAEVESAQQNQQTVLLHQYLRWNSSSIGRIGGLFIDSRSGRSLSMKELRWSSIDTAGVATPTELQHKQHQQMQKLPRP